MHLVDVHCHLSMYENVNNVINGIRSRSMDLVVTSGITPEDNIKSLEISKTSNGILVTFGLNPVSLGRNPRIFDEYMDVLMKNKEYVSGIGEVGIDYYWEKNEHAREIQRKFFSRFIQMSNDMKKPLIIHTRSAMSDTLNILERETPEKFFIHSFRGSVSQARRVIDLGGLISLSTAIVRFPGAYKRLINFVPPEYILTETDSPYLSPTKGETNFPWNVEKSLMFISKEKEMDAKKLSEIVRGNAQRIFGI